MPCSCSSRVLDRRELEPSEWPRWGVVVRRGVTRISPELISILQTSYSCTRSGVPSTEAVALKPARLLHMSVCVCRASTRPPPLAFSCALRLVELKDQAARHVIGDE